MTCDLIMNMRRLGKSIVGAINGVSCGAGAVMTAACDFRLAAPNAKIAFLFSKVGLCGADMGSAYLLPRLIGHARAAELLFFGDFIDAAEAERIGLVLKTVPHAELMPATYALAGKIAANPPLAVQHLKEGLRKTTYGDHREIGSWIAHILGILFQTEDHKEGVASFLEKRPAQFTGR